MTAYLRERMDVPLTWLPAMDFRDLDAAAQQDAIAYADPARALGLAEQHGFVPVVAATDADGVFLVTSRGAPVTPEAVEGARVAVAAGTFAAALGLHTLYQRGLRPHPVVFSSWQQAVRSVLSGDCAFALLYEATYRLLALRTLRLLQVAAGPWNVATAHLWLVRGDEPLLGLRLTEVLLAMEADPEGRALLTAIGVTGWRRATNELDAAKRVLAQANMPK